MIEIKKNIFFVGSFDPNREVFDELVHLPNGTSYNSYLIKGNQKIALIDTVEPTKTEELLDNTKDEKIDFIISNHAEQDHSGLIPAVLKKYPKAKVVTNEKCKNMLIDLLDLCEDNFLIVKDNDTLSLGDKTLKFILTPWVHWPETMSTYLIEDKILFSCDMFGSHDGTGNINVIDKNQTTNAAKLYFAEIMMPFSVPIKKNIEKIENLDIQIIAPSHGPIYREPKFIIELYKEWISDSYSNKIVIIYTSMHESTKHIVNYIREICESEDIEFKIHNAAQNLVGEIFIDLLNAPTIIFATPTFLNNPHPAISNLANLINLQKPKLKYLSTITSFGWATIAPQKIKDTLSNLNLEYLDEIKIKGNLKEEHKAELKNIILKIKIKHKELGII